MKQVEATDIPALVGMAERFHSASDMPFAFDAVKMADFFAAIVREGVVYQTERGFIAGTLAPAFAGRWIMAVELMWWAEDGQGLKLLRRFEEWAEASGADEIRMTTLAHLPEAGTVLARKGYDAIEVSHRKLV